MREEQLVHGELTGRIVGCAMEVHSQLGPGLLESAYRRFLVGALGKSGIAVRAEVPVPVRLDDIEVECGFRADLIVEEKVLLELKSVAELLPVHESQVLTYLKLTGLRVGLLINFNSTSLRFGIRRFIR